jgi:hypothetical protein
MQEARANHGLTGVDAGRSDLNENLAWAELGKADLTDGEDVSAAVPIEADSTSARGMDGRDGHANSFTIVSG